MRVGLIPTGFAEIIKRIQIQHSVQCMASDIKSSASSSGFVIIGQWPASMTLYGPLSFPHFPEMISSTGSPLRLQKTYASFLGS